MKNIVQHPIDVIDGHIGVAPCKNTCPCRFLSAMHAIATAIASVRAIEAVNDHIAIRWFSQALQ